MIEIDLLREVHRKRHVKESSLAGIDLSKLDLKKIPLVKVGIGLVSALAALHLVLYLLGAFSISRAGALSRSYKSILPQKEESDLLKARSEKIARKIKAINDLMAKRFGWAQELKNLSDSMIAGIWLSELDYEENIVERPTRAVARTTAGAGGERSADEAAQGVVTRYLVISGYAAARGAEGTALVGKFIQSLRTNPGFYSDIQEIELKSIKSDLVAGQEVMSFKISCLFKNR